MNIYLSLCRYNSLWSNCPCHKHNSLYIAFNCKWFGHYDIYENRYSNSSGIASTTNNTNSKIKIDNKKKYKSSYVNRPVEQVNLTTNIHMHSHHSLQLRDWYTDNLKSSKRKHTQRKREKERRATTWKQSIWLLYRITLAFDGPFIFAVSFSFAWCKYQFVGIQWTDCNAVPIHVSAENTNTNTMLKNFKNQL